MLLFTDDLTVCSYEITESQNVHNEVTSLTRLYWCLDSRFTKYSHLLKATVDHVAFTTVVFFLHPGQRIVTINHNLVIILLN
jgi:hypothetical protein